MSMIDRRAWRQPAQAVDMIRFLTLDAPDLPQDHYRELSDRQAATLMLGAATRHRNARRVLEKLVEDRVLDSVAGAGSRATAYRINGAFSQWRNVVWRPSKELAMVKLSALSALYRTARPGDSAVTYRTALELIVPSSIGRHKKTVVPSSGLRHNDLLCAVVQGTAQTGAFLGERINYSDSVEEISLSEEQSERLFKIKGALKRKTGERGVWGKPETMLKRLVVDGASTEELLELVAKLPPEMRVPSGVEWICEEWHARDLGDLDARSAEPQERSMQLKARREMIPRLLATRLDIGDDEGAEELRFEMEQIDSELSNLQELEA